MTPGLVIVLVVRLTAPLTILRWPLAGAIIAIVADTADILFFQAFGFPTFIGYNEIDKLLDLYYLSLELIVALGCRRSRERPPSCSSRTALPA